LLLLAVVAVVGAAAATSVTAGASLARREAEEHLLDVGAEFERALWSYRAASLGGPTGRSPKTLEELLKDSRIPGVKRHLRKLYTDPATGISGEWGVVRGADGSILGIYSLAAGMPVKRTGFPTHQSHFENARTYSDWVFGLPPEERERRTITTTRGERQVQR
jgi:type II secretory pathway pseudopilin PulG